MKTQLTATIVQLGPELSETELREAFAVSSENKLYRAIQQVLSRWAADRRANAAGYMNENNTIGMAGCVGAQDIIDTLIRDLEDKRQRAVKALT